MSSSLIRWGGLAAMLGSALGIVVAPVISSAYSLSEDSAGQAPPPWEPAFGNLFDPLFGFASPEAVYATYGRLYFLVFLGFLLGLLGFRAQRSGGAGRLERWGLGVALVGIALNLFGTIPDYWFGEGTWFEALGFFLGTFLGLIVLMVGSAMLGVALLRAGTASRLGAWLLILALPGTGLLTLLGFGNIPSGPALWFCFAWLVLGYALWSKEGVLVDQSRVQ